MKKNLQGTNSGADEAKSQINDLEHKEEKKIQNSKKKKESKKNKDRLKSLWDNFRCTNIWIIVVPEGEKIDKLKTYLKK